LKAFGYIFLELFPLKVSLLLLDIPHELLSFDVCFVYLHLEVMGEAVIVEYLMWLWRREGRMMILGYRAFELIVFLNWI